MANPIVDPGSREEVLAWALDLMSRRPHDVSIGHGQLLRWFVVPRNDTANVYLHQFCGSDEDRALHDHPFDNRSWILRGSYLEHIQDGRCILRSEGEIVDRRAIEAHRIEVLPDEDSPITLFLTGPRIREWGFYCPLGWRHWREFTDERDYGTIGRGCE